MNIAGLEKPARACSGETTLERISTTIAMTSATSTGTRLETIPNMNRNKVIRVTTHQTPQ